MSWNNLLNGVGRKTLPAGIFVLLCFALQAQVTQTRDFTKRYKIQPETRIEITNKYGRIELNTWEKDSVVVKVKMQITQKNASKLEKSLDAFDLDVTNSPYFLVVKTQVDKNKSQLEAELQKFKETMLLTNGSVSIDMSVWLPNNRELRLENKFGDIVMGDYTGETQIALSNGKLRMGEMTKNATINLNFADATIENLPNGRILANYSEIQVKNAGTLRFESKSSTIEIMNSQSLNIDSRRDKFRIRLANKVDATGNFTQFRIAELKEKANFRMSFGSLELEKVLSTFSSIFVDSRSADLNLYFSPESKFNFQITETKTDLSLAAEMKTEQKETLDPKEGKVRHVGYFGKKMKDDQLIINATGGETIIRSY